ncbi:DNA topoisomerase I [Methanococcus voltae]|uniref:DNA topoisomerase I n=1 Tax=Methanococcus voltae TaxID=2188 RepID=UPI001AE81A30|nr:DNA topoisomerase I [Methanococcus voltae]MBP2171830.1 DNA topoisomerase-1 [Methanococcus voltae]
MTGLIICEKPNVAKKIADALGKPKKKSQNKVPYYEVDTQGKTYYVASAVGHLYTLIEKNKTKFGDYPTYDIDWAPASTVEGKEYVQKYINVLKKLSKDANEYYVATDWDIEGELIGYHALHYACGQDIAKRMRFSSLTKKEIVKSFENTDSIDFGLVDAGDSRHKIDWFFGINISRALMQAISSAKRWKTMSTGRVQGPALAFLVEKELEIQKFIPVPYWVINANLKDNNGNSVSTNEEAPLIATHEIDKFWDEEEANNAYSNVEGQKEAIVEEIKKNKKKIKPYPPFDLGTLQRESHNAFRYSPKRTQEIAQKLYEKGYCSYPRTSSQKLPKDAEYMNEVLNKLLKSKEYGKYASEILEKNLKPIEGKKDDPAHPAIHPVDVPKEALPDDEQKLYNLIARRALAAFWDDAEREYSKVTLNINGEKFKLSGSRTTHEGWHEIYYFTKFDENELPEMKKGTILSIESTEKLSKETKPPKRYTMASIIKELETRQLGTKATRADILEKLTKRGYVIEDGSLSVTELGIGVIETLKKYCPEIVEETLTRDLEDKLEKIQDHKIKKEQVIDETKVKLSQILDEFRKKEKEIGAELVEKIDSTNRSLQIIGKCNCGGDLIIIKYKGKSRFVGCSNYPNCEITYPLPQKGAIKIPNKVCEVCGLPIINYMGKDLCVNIECSSRISEEDKKLLEKIENEKEGEKKCPKCDGVLTIKRGAFGVFRGCSNYPTCKYTENLKGESNEKEIVGKCPKCGSDLVKRKGRFGEFIGCSNYPKCRHTEKIKKEGEEDKVEKKETKKATTKKSTAKKTTAKKATTKKTTKKTATKKADSKTATKTKKATTKKKE